MKHDVSLVSLDQNEQLEIEGGVAPLVAFGLSIVGGFVAGAVDAGIQKATGKNVAQHTWDLIGKIF